MKKLIIIPAFNEAQNLDKVIGDIKQFTRGFDYIIVNDCSTDNTLQLCKKKSYNVLNLSTNLGIGGCVQAGYKYAKEHGYDIAVQFDGDAQHNAKYINDMYQYLIDRNVDMVIGSRFIEKSGFQSSKLRRVGIKFISFLIRVLVRKNITDPTSGFRMVNKSVIDSLCDYYPTDYPEPESIVSISRQGFRVSEIPVEMNERLNGESSINLTRSVYYMLKVSLAILIDSLKDKRGRVN
ncbi:glycosyltransferase family 2 protein [Paenibacillus sanguinis]|uniref:glycosyltransferase family 2 protein n=1 Tax=Paenibacillus sanguinis TaxID=225906 RepID=UPI000476931E|nr:glycosyltransferase family 2 protein [Paenibacillus sanguinis]